MQKAINLIKILQNANGTKEKIMILAENRDNEVFKQLLYYACHPRLTYKVSEDTLRTGTQHAMPTAAGNIFEVCATLSQKKALSDETLGQVCSFLAGRTDDEREVFIQILSKTLRLGVTYKTINKAISGLFPEWEVQQAYSIEKYPVKDGTWFALTQKLNGVRCTYYRGQLIARSGEPFEGLDHIANELAPWPDLVFDGELILKDKGDLSDNEAFRTATGIINSDGDKSRICFTIFDMLPVGEFDAGESLKTYFDRRESLCYLQIAFVDRGVKNTSILPVLYQGRDRSKIDEFLNQMVAEDKEGLMVNLATTYKCKRHSGILKVKRFYTMDLPIVRIEEGSGKYAGTTGALIVDYKGNEVGVGTGLTDEQRRFFWEFRDTYIGVLAEIKYKEISSDKKTGAESLQFPVFVQLRCDKDTVSYE